MRTHQRLVSARLAALGICFGCSTAASADTVLIDGFDDGTLDPAWQITFENAGAWSFFEAGSELVVTNIEHEETDLWSKVHLARPVAALADFHLRAEISWESYDEQSVMQHVTVTLRDGEGTVVASAYYWDAWIMWTGGLGGGIQDGSSWFSGHHSAPYDGSAVLEIGRTGSDVTIWIGGVERVAGTSNLPVEQVEISFGYFPHAIDGIVVSRFGRESIDLIEVTDPEETGRGDFDGDGVVGVGDLLRLLRVWGTCADCVEDLDGDGSVGVGDLLILLSLWGPVG